jgi:hypothetical protein
MGPAMRRRRCAVSERRLGCGAAAASMRMRRSGGDAGLEVGYACLRVGEELLDCEGTREEANCRDKNGGGSVGERRVR